MSGPKRLVLIVLLLFAFVGGTVSQAYALAKAPLICEMMATGADAKSGAGDGMAGKQPCKTDQPLCVMNIGCVVLPAVHIAPVGTAIAPRPSNVWDLDRASLLTGRAIKPDLFPPIPSA